MKERERPVVKLFTGAVIQLIPKPLFDLFNLRNDRSVRSALFLLKCLNLRWPFHRINSAVVGLLSSGEEGDPVDFRVPVEAGDRGEPGFPGEMGLPGLPGRDGKWKYIQWMKIFKLYSKLRVTWSRINRIIAWTRMILSGTFGQNIHDLLRITRIIA